MLKFIWVRLVMILSIGLYALPVWAGNNSGQAFSAWPDTGQTKCYNETVEIPCPALGANFYGQDAHYVGTARSYKDLGNGTVQDNITGLIWEQKSNLDGTADYSNPHDADNTYTWCDPDPNSNGGYTGTCGEHDTVSYIAALNAANFGGHNTWRLPTIKELTSLVDSSRVAPAIDPVFAVTTQGASPSTSIYWSSTAKKDSLSSTPEAWLIHFHDGFVSRDFESHGYYVRAVYSEQSPSSTNQFIDNGDTVTDTVTGLEWQKELMGPMSWKNALIATEGLSLAGKSDWRLPDKNELRSLIDFSRSYPSIDPAFPTTSSFYWTSTTNSVLPTHAWLVDFLYGYDSVASDGDKLSNYYIRAVRGGKSAALPPSPPNKSGITPVLFLLLNNK